jgi:hypothetical protein
MRRTLLILVGLCAAIALTIVPITLFGVFYLTPIILMYLIGQRVHAWLFNSPWEFTEDTKAGLEAALLCSFGGVVFGISYVSAGWHK